MSPAGVPICVAVMALLLTAAPLKADWSGFYASSDPSPAPISPPGPPRCAAAVPALSAVPALGEAPTTGCAPTAFAGGGVDASNSPQALTGTSAGCVPAILEAQVRYAIPDNLLLGIGLQEAGIDRGDGLTVWPWSVNVAGEGRFLSGPAEAVSWVRARQAEGEELIDVGCMQVNLRWHPDAFTSLEEGFDPARNVDYAARYLVGLWERTGDWRAAVGRYHSADPARAARYLAGVETNLRVLDRMSAPPVDGDLDRLLDALVSDAPEGAPRPLWSAGLGASGGREGPVYGLYGPSGLRPVLPNFLRDF